MEVVCTSEGEVMIGTSRKIPTSLTEAQVFRLFKCAVKDDDTLPEANPRPTFGPRLILGATVADDASAASLGPRARVRNRGRCHTINYFKPNFLTYFPRNRRGYSTRRSDRG